MLEPETEALIERALAEDLGLRDLTAEAVVDPGRRAWGWIEQKEPGVLYGLEVANAVFRQLDPLVKWHPRAPEGEWRKEVPATVVEIEGDARALLRASAWL